MQDTRDHHVTLVCVIYTAVEAYKVGESAKRRRPCAAAIDELSRGFRGTGSYPLQFSRGSVRSSCRAIAVGPRPNGTVLTWSKEENGRKALPFIQNWD
jgi:hypothetical protein